MPLLLSFGAIVSLATCGGGDESKAKDWSGAPLPEQAVDYCIKLAACTDEGGDLTVGQCVDAMADLQAFSGSVPTRRQLRDLVTLRECYNQALSCADVRRCVGIPTGEDLETCNTATHASSCAQRAGVSVLKRCFPAPDPTPEHDGVVVEVDCTRFGLVCGFDENNHNRCVTETCTVMTHPPSCEEETGDLEVCGGTDPVTGLPVGSIINEYACSALGLGCDSDLGDPDDPADDILICIGQGEECDPNAPWSCDGSVLNACLQNIDGSGASASWDCASGAIHRVCSPDLLTCVPTSSICNAADPDGDGPGQPHPGTCDGSNLTVCVDGELYTTDCEEHGLGDCEADADGRGACVE
jgi:hypothetical protein